MINSRAHILDLVPIIRVIADDINLKVQQVNLVLRLEHGDLLRSTCQLLLRLLQLLDLTLGSHPVALDFLRLPRHRLELLLDLPLLNDYLL